MDTTLTADETIDCLVYKLDFIKTYDKAYNRVDHNFLDASVQRVGFGKRWEQG